MSELTLQALAGKLDQLIQQHEQLQQENNSLRQAKHDWQEERARLIQKNDVARARVEAMIDDLKSLKEGVR
ncbi:TIGR02449 family protein [Eionea flava]